MENTTQHRALTTQLLGSNLNYLSYLFLLALVHVWHFTAFWLSGSFLKNVYR